MQSAEAGEYNVVTLRVKLITAMAVGTNYIVGYRPNVSVQNNITLSCRYMWNCFQEPNICLHFLSFINSELVQVDEVPPHGTQASVILQSNSS